MYSLKSPLESVCHLLRAVMPPVLYGVFGGTGASEGGGVLVPVIKLILPSQGLGPDS